MTDSEEDSGVLSQATGDVANSQRYDLDSDDDDSMTFARKKKATRRSARIDSDSDDPDEIQLSELDKSNLDTEKHEARPNNSVEDVAGNEQRDEDGDVEESDNDDKIESKNSSDDETDGNANTSQSRIDNPLSRSNSDATETSAEQLTSSLTLTRVCDFDIFDAQMDCSDSEGGRSSPELQKRGDRNSSDSDSDGDNQLSDSLKKRLAKGAAKKAAKGKPRNIRRQAKKEKDDVQDMHSETQRIVRTAAVKLPYHQPEKRDVSAFLARSELRRQQLIASHSAGVRQPWKQALQSIPVSSSICSAVSMIKPAVSTLNEAAAVVKDAQQLEVSAVVLPVKTAEYVETQHMSDVEPSDNSCSSSSFSRLPPVFLEQRTLPETSISVEISAISQDVLPEVAAISIGPTPNLDGLTICSTAESSVSSMEIVSPALNVRQDSYPVAKRKLLLLPEATATPAESSSSNGVIGRDIDEDLVESKECKTAEANSDDLCCPSSSTEKLQSGVGSSITAVKSKGRTMLDTVEKLVSEIPPPHLSVDLGEMINLDDGMESYQDGVRQLMERLISHSHGSRSAPKPKTIEISTVCKEKGDDEREQLSLKMVTYTLNDNEDDKIDSSLDIPGAKLNRLKAKLCEQMRAKRDEALAKRYELFGTRYGEASGSGYEAKRLEEDARAEEEAELTDQTDTDGESDYESIMDEEERVVKSQRESNPFVDEEADEDDDDDDDDKEMDDEEVEDDDEDSDKEDESNGSNNELLKSGSQKKDKPCYRRNVLVSDSSDDEREGTAGSEESFHLCLEDDVDDSENIEPLTSTTNAAHDIKRSSLQRTNTFEVFDEDANTESPTVSQRSNEVEDNDFKSRPFVRLLEDEFSSDNMPDSMNMQRKLDDTQTSMTSLVRESSVTSTDSTFDMLSSLIPGGQQQNRMRFSPGRKTPELFTQAKTRKSGGSMDEIGASIRESTPLRFSSALQAEDSFNLVMENATETQSCPADDDWLTGSRVRRSLLGRNNVDSMQTDSQSDVDELLLLCSGSFKSGSEAGTKERVKSLFPSDSQQKSDSNELLDLCSGQFGGTGTTSVWTAASKSRGSIYNQELSAMDSNSLLDVLSGKFTDTQQPTVHLGSSMPAHKRSKKRKAVIHDDDIEEMGSNDLFEVVSNKDESISDEDEDSESSDDDTLQRDEDDVGEKVKFTGFVEGKKKGKIRQEFVEQEAELSGSEADSDENFDLDENDDEMEREEGDADDVGTEEELRNQVHRVHLKKMIDADDREIRLLQEQFLDDGDLHSDGFGRMRRFRWQNSEEANEEQNATQNDNEFDEEDDGEREAKWRIERLEREKFLEEHKSKRDDDGDSQLIRLGKTVLSARNTECNTPNQVTPQPLRRSSSASSASVSVAPIFKVPSNSQRLTHGSFLKRSKETLAKITELMKPVSNMNGPRSSRNFVFSTVSPDEKSKPAPRIPQGVTRSSSVVPMIKRPRLDRSLSVPQMMNSRLSLLE